MLRLVDVQDALEMHPAEAALGLRSIEDVEQTLVQVLTGITACGKPDLLDIRLERLLLRVHLLHLRPAISSATLRR